MLVGLGFFLFSFFFLSLHALHDFLFLHIVAQGVQQVEDSHVFVLCCFQHVLRPCVAFAAHENEQVTLRDGQDILGGGLKVVQIHTGIQQHDHFRALIADDLPDPVIDRKNSGNDFERVFLGKHNRHG